MIKIAVCDDEQNMITYLSTRIKDQYPECDIAEYTSGEDILADGKEYDLVFLDIEMKSEESGMDGMSLAKKIRKTWQYVEPLIIFVTGHEEYVYEAFDVGAFHYLVKPVEEERFQEVLKKALTKIEEEKARKKKALTIQYAGTSKVIPLESIYYIESAGHKVILHGKTGQLEYYAKIGDLEKELMGQFSRIHKGYLINLSYVDEYSRTEVKLTESSSLLISKYKYRDFVKAYLRFIQ